MFKGGGGLGKSPFLPFDGGRDLYAFRRSRRAQLLIIIVCGRWGRGEEKKNAPGIR